MQRFSHKRTGSMVNGSFPEMEKSNTSRNLFCKVSELGISAVLQCGRKTVQTEQMVFRPQSLCPMQDVGSLSHSNVLFESQSTNFLSEVAVWSCSVMRAPDPQASVMDAVSHFI